jgi:hypothetical protein
MKWQWLSCSCSKVLKTVLSATACLLQFSYVHSLNEQHGQWAKYFIKQFLWNISFKNPGHNDFGGMIATGQQSVSYASCLQPLVSFSDGDYFILSATCRPGLWRNRLESDCGSEGMGFDPHSGQSKVRLFSLSILTDKIVLVVQSTPPSTGLLVSV